MEEVKDQTQQLSGGAYEIIRSRLETHGGDLRERLTMLDHERHEVFGAIEPSLIATERVSTKNNCTPRDMVAIGGNRFLFAYNVQLGLRSTTELNDVFACYEYDQETHIFHELPLDILDSNSFEEDFKYLYKYYKNASFSQFRIIGAHLYMAFQSGKDVTDVKAFKWVLNNGSLSYEGNRYDHEYVFPSQQEFAWKRAHRDMHRSGEHPHISIEDRVFVETVGGDLTVKVEDNTKSGEGIYAEPVENVDQTLDDAETFYAIVGSLILLKIRPYQEDEFRYLVFNEKTNTVVRIDAIEDSCVLLPDDHGIIFSNGYHLQTGETKVFESSQVDMLFERRIASSNGEDFLYVFYNRTDGTYVLLSYNLIRREVETPIACHGYSTFPDGELIYFRSDEEPQKHHTLQVWKTPYVGEEFIPEANTDSYLYKVGNAEVVRCMAECYEVLNLLAKDDSYADLYVDLAKKTGDITDSYFWVGKPEAQTLSEPLDELQNAARAAIEEFDKVVRMRRATAEAMKQVAGKSASLLRTVEHTRPDDIMGFVHHLAELRTLRGEIIALRDLSYVDSDRIDGLEESAKLATEKVSQHCVEFLLLPEALDPYRDQVAAQKTRVPEVTKVAEGNEVEEELLKAGEELEMLIDIVSNLKIEDATQTTQIIDSVSDIYSTLNQVKVELKNRKQELGRSEGIAQFQSQVKLLNQAVINYLDLCDTPEKCEEFLTKTMVQLEELEGRFSEFDEFISELGEKRDEVYNAFESRKVSLLEKRNKRAGALMAAAERILTGIRNRLKGFQEITEIHSYLASDLMIEKVRDLIAQLNEIGDNVKADDLQTRLKTLREDAVRQLKDRKELFVDGDNIIKLGKHKFSVSKQDLELSIVPKEGEMHLHLTGTNFFQPVEDEAFLATRDAWEQEVVSENAEVYRGEFLAWRFFRQLDDSEAFLNLTDEEMLDQVQKFMGPRYAEGYTKGVHDEDALRILCELVRIGAGIGLLRFDTRSRALGLVYWEQWNSEDRATLTTKLRSFGLMRKAFVSRDLQKSYVGEIEEGIRGFIEGGRIFPEDADAREAAEYLFEEISRSETFTVSPEAAQMVQIFERELTAKRLMKSFKEACDEVEGSHRFQIIRDWVTGFVEVTLDLHAHRNYINEASALLFGGGFERKDVVDVSVEKRIEGMLGTHASIDEERGVDLHFNAFQKKLIRYDREVVPLFERYGEAKSALIEERRNVMRLDEFKPRVMTSFVRNRLLDQVYLPIIGDNLAKQIGVAGVNTRTDRMGLLLLVSPPGYGKTTLMEYVSDRLGLTFMKINGPAIGHNVTSLDPEEAPNASAREEVNKLNLSLEMGDNVMIYLDDIQHCNPEFLQKFISLCDGQRRIEGVYNGVAKTYDLRGKKVAVVMAGNPYTESGGKFQIPDMLANRADTYNLGDILGGHQKAFEASYIENCLTSNPTLSKLASRSQKDVYAIMQIAETGSQDGVDFEVTYSAEEVNEFTDVMKKLFRVRDTILRVNLEYIASAAQEDEYRTEPPFKLQGSYRNMNRIAEKILPIMTDEEVESTIMDHYDNESQTLTTGAEANMLKFREMEGVITDDEMHRWEEIRKTFKRNLVMGGAGDTDPVNRVVGQLASFNEGLETIQNAIASAGSDYARPQTLGADTVEQLQQIINGLRSVPVDVEIKVMPVEETARKTSNLPVDVDSQVEQKG